MPWLWKLARLVGCYARGNEVSYENGNVTRFQRRVADISITSSDLRNIGFTGAVRVARDFLAGLDLGRLGDLRNEAAFMRQLNEHTNELKARLQACRAKQGSVRNNAELWGSARKVINVFLCEAYFNRVLAWRYGLRRIRQWLEVPLDSELAAAIRNEAEQYGLNGLPAFPAIIRLDENTGQMFQHCASEVAKRRALPARIYLEVVTWHRAQN